MTTRDKNVLLSILRGNPLNWVCLLLSLLSKGLSPQQLLSIMPSSQEEKARGKVRKIHIFFTSLGNFI